MNNQITSETSQFRTSLVNVKRGEIFCFNQNVAVHPKDIHYYIMGENKHYIDLVTGEEYYLYQKRKDLGFRGFFIPDFIPVGEEDYPNVDVPVIIFNAKIKLKPKKRRKKECISNTNWNDDDED